MTRPMTHLKLRTLREVDLEMVAVTALNVAFRDSSREWRDAVVELRFRDVILSQKHTQQLVCNNTQTEEGHTHSL